MLTQLLRVADRAYMNQIMVSTVLFMSGYIGAFLSITLA